MARQTLRHLVEQAGGYYIRPSGAGCLVRWPNGVGGEIVRETRGTLQNEISFQEYVQQTVVLPGEL